MSSRPELKVCQTLSETLACLAHTLRLLRSLTTTPAVIQVDDEHGFIRFFKSLPTVDDDVIRIFDRGDWYTAHGENANFIARTVRPSWHSSPSAHSWLTDFG